MNYRAFTTDELIRLAMTDAGARAFIADNAVEILEQVKEAEEETFMGMAEDRWHDGYMEGKYDGAHNALCHLRNKYGKDLEWALDRIEKQAQKQARGQLSSNGQRIFDLLQALRTELNGY